MQEQQSDSDHCNVASGSSNGHVNNGTVMQGQSSNGDTAMNHNGVTKVIELSDTDKDIVRILAQHLKSKGLERSADALLDESGCILDHPSATKFRQNVLAGKWSKADHYLKELEAMMSDYHSNLVEMRFLLLEAKYLEYLDEGLHMEALHVLRNELTPLKHNTDRVHQLSSYMMCSDSEDLRKRARWEGKGPRSRAELMTRLQTYLPPSIMLPPRRLCTLLSQALELQAEKCECHDMSWKTDMEAVSLLNDHNCSTDEVPMKTLQILKGHDDEVMYCKFSPDGLFLATGGKDNKVIIWDVNPETLVLKELHVLEGHDYGVIHLAWSPDSKHLIVCGQEDCQNIWIWNLDDDKGPRKAIRLPQPPEESYTCAAFNRDGTKFVTGGMRGHFFLWDMDFRMLDSWDSVRVNCLAFRSDNKTILASDTHFRIRAYKTECNPHRDQCLVQEHDPILSFSINSEDRLAVVNVAHQGLHLWDLKDKMIVKRFQGVKHGHFIVHSCFGGRNESYIASGSEDANVYLYHLKRETPIGILQGHLKTVNCVSWNPVYPSLLASASDDNTVRIWGPRSAKIRLSNMHSESGEELSSSTSSSSWNITIN